MAYTVEGNDTVGYRVLVDGQPMTGRQKTKEDALARAGIKGEADAGTGEAPLSKLKVAELKAYATENSIDLGDASKKDDILAVIEAAKKETAAETGDDE